MIEEPKKWIWWKTVDIVKGSDEGEKSGFGTRQVLDKLKNKKRRGLNTRLISAPKRFQTFCLPDMRNVPEWQAHTSSSECLSHSR